MTRFAPLLLLLAPAAHAGATLGLDGGYAVPVPDADGTASLGMGGRVGLSVDLNAVELVPEVGASWYGSLQPQVGGRVLFGTNTRPGLYGHLRLPLDSDLKLRPGYDAGATLDFGAPRTLGFGLFLGVASRSLSEPVEDLSLVGGAQLTLRL